MSDWEIYGKGEDLWTKLRTGCKKCAESLVFKEVKWLQKFWVKDGKQIRIKWFFKKLSQHTSLIHPNPAPPNTPSSSSKDQKQIPPQLKTYKIPRSLQIDKTKTNQINRSSTKRENVDAKAQNLWEENFLLIMHKGKEWGFLILRSFCRVERGVNLIKSCFFKE